MTDTCFVIMPFGQKTDHDGKEIDFDRIYRDLIQRAVREIPGLEPLRCDEIEKPGWIHKRMIEHILHDRVTVVDTSTLNANVFYELGARHALRRAVTVLIHRKGTTFPFNVSGMARIDYSDTEEGRKKASRDIRSYIQNALDDPDNVDSLVHEALPGLRVEYQERVPRRLTRFSLSEYPVAARPEKRVGFVSGDYDVIQIGDAWVNSENTEMKMDSYYGKSTSATLRYLGAEKDLETGLVETDSIADELEEFMRAKGVKRVAPGSVVVTGPGALAENNVKWIFHVASVVGEPREGFRPIERIERCVTNVLKMADSARVADDPPRSIMLPILGTGPAGGDLETHLRRFLETVVAYLEDRPNTHVSAVYFYVWTDVDSEICHEVARGFEGLGSPPQADGAVVAT